MELIAALLPIIIIAVIVGLMGSSLMKKKGYPGGNLTWVIWVPLVNFYGFAYVIGLPDYVARADLAAIRARIQ